MDTDATGAVLEGEGITQAEFDAAMAQPPARTFRSRLDEVSEQARFLVEVSRKQLAAAEALQAKCDAVMREVA